MRPLRFRYLIVDLDDTLVPEWDFVAGGYRAAAAMLAPDIEGADPEALFNRFVYEHQKYGRRDIIDRIVVQVKGNPDVVPKLVAAYREHKPELSFFPGAADALRGLRSAGCRVAVVTDGAAGMQQRKVDAARLDQIVDAVIYCWEMKAPKPDVAAFAEAMRRLGATKAETLIVGDDPYLDIAPATQLGVAACRVRTGRYALVEHSPEGAVHDLPTFADVARWLLASNR